MLPDNERQVPGTENSIKPATMQIDNEVLLALQREYSMMEQEHARIRAQALASESDGAKKGLLS